MTPTFYWGFTAQQAVEKLLKVLIVLRDQRPPRSHELSELAALAEVELPTKLLGLQTCTAILAIDQSK